MSSTAPPRRADRPARVLLATRSPGKLRELRALFASHGLTVLSLDDAEIQPGPEEDDLETCDSFEGNALAKARHFQRVAGMPAVADDSGIVVDALQGAPGVLSKRWSGRAELSGQALDDANNQLLLQRLAGATSRRAHYVCAAAWCDVGREMVERGEVHGVITHSARGSGGFGYDPYFLAEELGRTFGEVSLEEKQQVSHRARAFAKLLQRITSSG